MIEERLLDANDLRFVADVAGSPDAPLILLLHGFPQTRYTWRGQVPALAEAGYLAVAPDQRGYSPGARPERVEDYATDRLTSDALAIADGLGAHRFHLVGHDWGGQLAWLIAAQYPERVRTLTVLSRPHPAAFARAMSEDEEQSDRSRHHRAFQDPTTAQRLLADDCARLRATLADQGVPARAIDAYLDPLSSPGALDAALNWYRAGAGTTSTLAGSATPATKVPTLYLWGDEDATVGRRAAELTEAYVDSEYRFVVIEGAGHFITDQQPDQVTRELLVHLEAHRERR